MLIETPDILDRDPVRALMVPNATVAVSISAAGSERFVVELAAVGRGPPAGVRLRHWLKSALRTHGLACRGVAPVPVVPTGGMAATNAAGKWRPSGRSIRRATVAPARHRIGPVDGQDNMEPGRPRDRRDQ